MNDKIWTIGRILKWTEQYFKDKGIESPRLDAEVLLAHVLEKQLRFADIGTGSGAICLSVLHYLAGTVADTVDISPAARAVAEENAASLGLADRITFHTGDLLQPLSGISFAAILSNPPYIPEADIVKLAPEVRLKEPHTALSGGQDGLDFYRRLANEAPAMLVPGGFTAFEVGIHQAGDVADLLKANPLIDRTEILPDYAGIDRVVVGWRKN